MLVFDLGFCSVFWFDDCTDTPCVFVICLRAKTAHGTRQMLSQEARDRDEIIQVGPYRSPPCTYLLCKVSVLWQGARYRD
jgi:hypothetical protein